MKRCIKCKELLDESEFHFRKDSQTYRTACIKCETKRKSAMAAFYTPPIEVKERKQAQVKAKRKKERLDLTFRAKFILEDSKKIDRRKGRDTTITVEFVQQQINEGCSYCGDRTTMMTLDRIDNNMGHTVENVVASCYRCNIIRGNMPYAAWIELAPHIKRVFEAGLFDKWDSIGPRKIKSAALKP